MKNIQIIKLTILIVLSFQLYAQQSYLKFLDDSVETSNELTPLDLTDSCAEVTACGGAWTKACASVVPNQGNLYTLKVFINSHGHCGGEAPVNWEDYFFYGQQTIRKEIYGIDDTGCGGGNWDMGGWAYIEGGACSGGWCSYKISIVAKHGGVGSQCRETNETHFLFQFPSK